MILRGEESTGQAIRKAHMKVVPEKITSYIFVNFLSCTFYSEFYHCHSLSFEDQSREEGEDLIMEGCIVSKARKQSNVKQEICQFYAIWEDDIRKSPAIV